MHQSTIITLMTTLPTTFSKNRVTKVTFKDLELFWDENHTLERNLITSTELMPSCFGATTEEQTIVAAFKMKFTGHLMYNITKFCGVYILTYKFGTLRVITQQGAPTPLPKSMDESAWEADEWQYGMI